MSLKQIEKFSKYLKMTGSVIPNIFSRVLWCGAFGLFVSVLYFYNIPVFAKSLGGVIPSIVLGLLLVFRTNTAYERFWEGRKAWGSIVNNIRNLSRLIWVAIDETDPSHRPEKEQALKLLIAFAVATKLHLRSQPASDRLADLVSTLQFSKLQTATNPPLEVIFWISDYLQAKHEQLQISLYQMNELQALLNNLVDMLGACERILRTPMPLAYAIHLKQLLFLYCLLLPFQVVEELRWWTAPAIALVSFTLFGIEAIGVEIENPFGSDPNDLPLDLICDTVERNVEDLIRMEPHYRRLNIYGNNIGEQLN
jgi:ion channel-forming bestrophin family protein